MRVQPMIAHANTKTGAHPEQEQRHRQRLPTEHEQGGDRPNVEKAEGDAINPVYFSRGGDLDQVGGHGLGVRLNQN